MTKTMRILTLLAVMMFTAGQAWAQVADLGYIVYTQGANDGGALTFYTDASCSNAITIDGTTHKSEALSSSDLTERTVYIKATPDFGYTVMGVTIDVKKGIDSNDMQAPRRSPGITDDVTVTAVTGKPGIYYFTMPNDANTNVTVTASFPAKTTENVEYYGLDGYPFEETAYVLDGTEEYLGIKSSSGTYRYVVPEGGITYSHALEFYGTVFLILRDDATMTINTSDSDYGTASDNSGIDDFLLIYGQSEGSGQLNVSNSQGYGLFADNGIYIEGGQVNVEGKTAGIVSNAYILLRGGTVSATSTDGSGILAKAHVQIYGGQVTATGSTANNHAGICSANSLIHFTFQKSTDYVKSNSYLCRTEGKSVLANNGKRYVAYNMANESDISASAIVSGASTDANATFTLADLAGRTLKPLDGNYVSINSGDFTFSGTTSFTSPFTITTGTGENETTTHYYIYKKDDTATLTYTGNGIVQLTGATLSAVENEPLQRTFTMPAADVALTATAVTGLTATTVTYDGNARTPEIKQGDDVFNAANYTIAYKVGDDDVTAADVKDANTYTCTLTGVGQYVGTTTVPFTIDKADYHEPEDIQDITKYVPSDKSGSFTIALPALPEGATYSFTKTDEGDVIATHSYDAEHNTLTYTTNSGTTGGTAATITVEATDAPNYNDYSFNVNVVVSEYTTAYAWPEQTSIWLDADNELVWAEGGVTLNTSLLTVTKGGTAVTDYTAKVGETTLTTGENTLTLEPGAYRIAITSADGQLDDWVDFKVIKLIENDPTFTLSVLDCTWPLVGDPGSDAATTPPTNTATLLCNGENLSYSTDANLDEFLSAHSGLKLWFENNDDMPDSNPVNRVFSLNSLADGDVCNVFEQRESWKFNGLGSIKAIGGIERLVYMPGGMGFMGFKLLTDADGEPVSASSEGGYIYYLGDERPDLHYVETVENDVTKWALYNGDELVPEGCYFLDDPDVYYGNGSAYTTYNAGSTGEFISFYPINFVINESPVDWNPVGLTLDPNRADAFYMDAYGAPRFFSIENENCVIVGKDFVYGNSLFYTGDVVPEVVDGNKIKIGGVIRSTDDSPSYPTPVVWLKNATIADLVPEARKWPHAYAKNKVDDYHYQVASCSFIIYPNNSNVVISDVKSSYKVGEDVTFTVELHGPKTGGANVFLNGEWMKRLEGTGKHEVILPGQYEGIYTIDVYGDCDEYVTGYHAFTTIYVVKYDTGLTLTGTTPTGAEFEDGDEVQYDPENPVIVNAVNDESVSGTSWKWMISNTDVVTEDHIVKTTVNNAPNSEDIYLNTVGLGEVTLTARFSGNDKYNPGTTSIAFTVVPMAVTSPIIELASDETIYYDGDPKTPAVNVYYAEGKLIPADQYDVTYENNTDASNEAKIIVKSKTGALYTINTEKEFTISPAPVMVKNDQNEDVPAATGDATITEDQNGITLTLITSDENTAPQAVEIPLPVEVDHIEILRLFANGRAATVYLPFAIEVGKITGGTFHTFTSVDETTTPWTVNYSEALASTFVLQANTPYIFLPDGSNGGKMTVNNTAKVTVCTANPHSTTQGMWEFIGTNSPIVWDANHADLGKVYGFAAEDKTVDGTNYEIGQFVRVGAGASIASMRAYMKYTSTTNAPAHQASGENTTNELPKTMRVVIGSGNVTAIDTLDMNVGDSDDWYSINGQKLSGKPTVKGIFIHNGVKVGIK